MVFAPFSFLSRHTLWLLVPMLVLQSQPSGASDVNFFPLSRESSWLKLLYYQKKSGDRYESRIDDPSFFLALDGKTDPAAELRASYLRFKNQDQKEPIDQWTACRMPARYEWIRAQIDPNLPTLRCPALGDWLDRLRAKGLVLVFASYYMGSSASIFGHTFLRIDTLRDEQHLKMLDYGVNFAADATTDNPFLYALNGLIGNYKGRYSIVPYALKVREYNDVDSRDLWEYTLNFSDAEVQRYLLHLWEVGNSHADYYFFSENCSFFLLLGLEAARPELDLSAQLPGAVIPVDTLKVLVTIPGLVKQIDYRPSRFAKALAAAQGLTAAEEVKLSGLIEHRQLNMGELDLTQQSRVVDAYLEYMNYKEGEDWRSNKNDSIWKHELLVRRSQLPVIDQNLSEVKPPLAPHVGHKSSQISAFARDGRIGISYLPAFHSLLSPEPGYRKNSQIELLRTELSYGTQSQRFRLEGFRVLGLSSLNPWSRIDRPYSWTLALDTRSDPESEDARVLRTDAETSGGISLQLHEKTLGYTMAMAQYSHGQNFGSGQTPRSGALSWWMVSLGPKVGVLTEIAKGLKLHMAGQWLNQVSGEGRRTIELRLRYFDSVNFEYQFSVKKTGDFIDPEASVGIYF